MNEHSNIMKGGGIIVGFRGLLLVQRGKEKYKKIVLGGDKGGNCS